MIRKIVHTPDRVEYTYPMAEFKQLLGIEDDNDVLVVNASVTGLVTVRMSWSG